MANLHRVSLGEIDAEQAITALKRGSYLLKYGRRGKPKFCPFRLSSDEITLIWYVGKEEKHLRLSHVSRIVPGQRTICKDKDEAEIWFVALRALISRDNRQKWRREARSDSVSSDNSSAFTQRNSQSCLSSRSSDGVYENSSQRRLGRAFSDFILYNAAAQGSPQTEFGANSLCSLSSVGLDDLNSRNSSEAFRASLSSAISSSSQGSYVDDFDTLGDVFLWGEGICHGLLGGGMHRIKKSSAARMDALLPKALESASMLDAQFVSCGSRHAVLVTKQGEIFSWGEGSGGRLGHGVETDVSNPKLVNTLTRLNIKSVACGEYHTCAVTLSGDIYSWGDGIHHFGLLGHGTEVSHWMPRKVKMEGLHVSSVSCGPWHTAAVTSVGQLFTFGDGTFGALGHGDCSSTSVPREVEVLKGLHTVRVSCGVWHTAAVVEVTSEPSSSSKYSIGKLFTWGNGDEGQLGHGDKKPRLVPCCVAELGDTNFCQVACGHSITIALTTSGQVYTMGSDDYGQLGSPGNASRLPTCIEGNLKNNFIERIACGSHHVAVLSSRYEVYTWGKGVNGQLGHGDNDDRNSPTLVQALKDKRVKSVACGSNFTAAICLHKGIFNSEHAICSGCRNPFNFRRKRHNCYNCGLVFCKACRSKKSLKASLAPNINKPYRVCEDCFAKLNKARETGLCYLPPKVSKKNIRHKSGEPKEKETSDSESNGLLSKLSSFDSFRQADRRQKSDPNSSYVSPVRNGSIEWESYTSNSSTSMFDNSEELSASLPGSSMHSRAASPASLKFSPSHSMSIISAFTGLACPENSLDNSKQANDNLTKEISILREQLNDMVVRVPQGSSFCRSGSFTENASTTLTFISTFSQLTS